MVLSEIISRNARRHLNKIALSFEDKRYTFAELNSRVNRLANGLLSLGLKKGDMLAVLADNCPEYAEIFWAGAKTGIVIVPLNCSLGETETSYILDNSEAKAIIVSEDYRSKVNSIRGTLVNISNFIAIGDEGEGMRSYQALLDSSPSIEVKEQLDEEGIFCIFFTSGTTGLSKGVIRTHRATVAAAVDAILSFRYVPGDVLLPLWPCYTVGYIWSVMSNSYLGNTFTGIRRFDPQQVFETIEKEKVTVIFITAGALTSLIEYPEAHKYDYSSLGKMIYAGAPLPVAVLRRGIELFGNIFYCGYGSTEAAALPSCLPPEGHIVDGSEREVKRLASCGKETLNAEVRVADEDGKDIAPGKTGEVIWRADYLPKGYWKMPELTAETIRGGFVYTGDLATVDEEGYIYILDRKKDMITSSGHKIYSREIEEVLYYHPAVLEAAVIGMPDKKLGEMVKAVVVLRAGKKASSEEIIEFCRQRLPGYSVPGSVDFLTELPRNPTGKVLKRVLRVQSGVR